MTDEYLYNGISVEHKLQQRSLADHKISRANLLISELCKVDPDDRDIERILAAREAIKFWTKSKNW